MLYDTPLVRGYEILTHSTPSRIHQTNGFSQVGAYSRQPPGLGPLSNSYRPALLNPNLSGLRDSDPYRGLSDNRLSDNRLSGKRYRVYRPGLKDAYINDSAYGAIGRGRLGNIAQDLPTDITASDIPAPVSGDSQNLVEPTPADQATAVAASGGLWSSISTDLTGVFGGIFSSGAQAAGSAAVSKITGALAPAPRPAPVVARPGLLGSTTPMSTWLVGGGIALAAFYFMRK